MTNTASNVIQFPKSPVQHTIKVIQDPPSDDLTLLEDELAINKITEEVFASLMLTFVEDYRLDFAVGRTDLFMKDAALVVESIRSLVKKYYGYEHVLQPLAAELFHINSPHENDPSRPQ